MIKVIIEGVHTVHRGQGFYDIDPLTSSVTLIRRAGVNLVFNHPFC